MRSDDRRGGLVIVGWFLGAVALLAMAGLLGWWYFYWNFTPPWAAPPCSKEACPDRYRASLIFHHAPPLAAVVWLPAHVRDEPSCDSHRA
jgi:hypothetical protein